MTHKILPKLLCVALATTFVTSAGIDEAFAAKKKT